MKTYVPVEHVRKGDRICGKPVTRIEILSIPGEAKYFRFGLEGGDAIDGCEGLRLEVEREEESQG